MDCTAAPTPTLDGLPTELIHQIARELDADGFFSLRLSAQYMAKRTEPVFLERFFRHRCHMLSHASLCNLLETAQDAVFGPAVRTLEIGVYHVTDDPAFGIPAIAGGAMDRAMCDIYLAEQDFMQDTGLDTICLRQALKDFPNCRTIVIGGSKLPLDARRIQRHTGVELFTRVDGNGNQSEAYVARVILVVLTAIMTSRSAMEELCITFGEKPDCRWGEPLRPPMLRLPPIIANQLRVPLSSVKVLTMAVDCASWHQLPEEWARDLADFIELFAGLERLSLSFISLRRLKPKLSRRKFRMLGERLLVPQIRSLKLKWVRCDEAALSDFILSHRHTIREVSLEEINVVGGHGWEAMATHIKSHLPYLERWTAKSCDSDGVEEDAVEDGGESSDESIGKSDDESSVENILDDG